jgi:hypothetical protein
LSPDTRQHRGAHPSDRILFSLAHLPVLRTSVADLSWLLTRGYTPKAALKIVGDKHSLSLRQRLAVARAACSDQSLVARKSNQEPLQNIAGAEVIVDGFNLIITVEAALSHGLLILCRDESVRDLSSVHGSYRSVSETEMAINLIGKAFEELLVKSVEWVLDRPISNSGRLAKRILDLAHDHMWPWSVELSYNPDEALGASGKIAITSDGVILERVPWVNLKEYLINQEVKEPWVVDLRS